MDRLVQAITSLTVGQRVEEQKPDRAERTLDPDAIPRQRLAHPLHTYPILPPCLPRIVVGSIPLTRSGIDAPTLPIKRKDLNLPTERCFELTDFFTAAECATCTEESYVSFVPPAHPSK